jgi:tetratricopeptide (TPR) repeat protein
LLAGFILLNCLPVHATTGSADQLNKLKAQIEAQQVSQTTFDSLQAILKAEPNNALAHVLLAKSYDALGMREMARDEYALAHKLDPQRPKDALAEFKTLYGSDTPANAFRNWVEIRKVYPRDPDVAEMENIVALLFTTVAEAENSYVAEQKHGHALMGIATMMSVKRSTAHRYADALRLANADLKLHDTDINATIAKATALNGLGRYQDCIKTIEPAFAKFPFQGGTAYNLAIAYERSGLYEAALLPALMNLSRANEGVDHEVATKMVARLFTKVSPKTKASTLATVQKKLGNTRFQNELHLGLGEVYENMGNPGAALVEYKAALDRDPNNGKLVLKLASASERAGDYELALQAYMSAQTLLHDEEVVERLRRLELRLINPDNDFAWRLKSALQKR